MTVPLEKIPFAGTVPSPVKENEGMITGKWRVRRPVLDVDKCTNCRTCWISCPDAIISVSDDGPLSFNRKYCKGCGICSEVCPVGAISLVPELDFED
jgi:2-oxoacid:acceptor oxidoreductase delta subunit (pyruvate/2-ketoisovalerate family)